MTIRTSHLLRAAYTPLRNAFHDRDSSDQLAYIVFSGIKTMVQLVTGLWVARLVAPEDIGVWQGVVILQAYMAFLSLGVPASIKRAYAIHKGAGRDDLAINTAGVGLLWTLISSAISAVIVLGVMVYLWAQGYASKTMLAVMLFSIPAFFVPLMDYYESLYHGENRFRALAKVNFLSSLFLIISVGFVYAGGWVGLFARYASIPLVAVLLRRYWLAISIKLRWDRQVLLELVRFGLKVLVANYISGLLLVADRTLIATNLGSEALGLYSLALTAQTAMIILPSSFTQVIYTRMNYRYGQSGKLSSLKRLAFLPVIVNAVALIIPAIVLMILVRPTVRLILPNYVGGIPAARWMVLSGYFMMLRSSGTIFSTRDRMLPYSLLLLAALGCMYALGWIAVRQFGTIESVAIVKTITMALLALGINVQVYFYIAKSEGTESHV